MSIKILKLDISRFGLKYRGVNMKVLNCENFKKEVLEADEPVLVDFWAEWCMPCKWVAPVLEKLSKEFEGKMKFAKLNVDECRKIAEEYRIEAIPTMIIFKDGKEVHRIIGAYPEHELKREIEKFVA